jgi:hypothetical protein
MMVIDTILGLAGLGVSTFAIIDNRRQRNQREKAVIAARTTIERIYGLLIGIKPAVDAEKVTLVAAINDGLSAINKEREKFDAL